VGDLQLVKLITVIRKVNTGGYSRQALGHELLGKWTVHHVVESSKGVGSRERETLVPAVEILFPQTKSGN